MSWTKSICYFAFCALLAAPAMAAPKLEILDGGLVGGNRKFEVWVTPDPTLYSVDTNNDTVMDASSIAVELGLSSINPRGGALPNIVNGSIVVTAAFQDDTVAPLGNTGYNPYQSGALTGINYEASGKDIFAPLGSTGTISQPLVGVLSGRTKVMDFQINDDIGVIDLRGWNAGTSAVGGALIAQDATIFTVDANFGIAGDYQPNGIVDIIDFGLFGAAFNKPSASFPDSDFNRSGGNIDIIDFGIFGGNFGRSMPTTGALQTATVPEPSSVLMVLAGVAGLAFARRCR